MATTASLVSRVRLELGDMGKSFVTQFVADGTTNRFQLHYAPLDAAAVVVFRNGTNITTTSSIEESTGTLVTDVLPVDGDEFTVSGLYYRYFTDAELASLVDDAVLQHSSSGVDSLGRKMSILTLPANEEYPVAIYAVTLALYTLATDASFDIDISAPDGVSIPRAERYRQLMDMVSARQTQYRDLCVHLGIGMYKIDVFSLRRISKGTGRYVPVYKPQEVDDRSYPQRVDVPAPTYGDKPLAWQTQSDEFTAYQGRPFTINYEFEYATAGTTFTAVLLHQRGGRYAIQNFTATFVQISTGRWRATLSLTGDQTLRLAGRTYWSIQKVVDGDTFVEAEIKGGNFFTQRYSEALH
jgi:hypothetical protein